MVGPSLITPRRAILAAALGASSAPRAQPAWPNRPVRIIIPFAPSGGADTFTRLMTEPLAAAFGQPFIVENRPGGGGVIGTDAAAKSTPDGHTLLMLTVTLTANETLMPNRPYVLLRDLAPVASLNRTLQVLVVNPALPVTTVAELVEWAKTRPGQLDYATAGPGTPYHIAFEVFRHMAGIQVQHIPFRLSGDARNAVVGGQVPAMFDGIATMLPLIRAGRVRALATTGTERSTLMPDTPTVAETLPGYEQVGFNGLLAPFATPRAVIERLNAEINRIIATDAIKDAFARLGAEIAPMPPEAFGDVLRADIERRRVWINLAGIQPQ
ncbi:Bug family tripartite tricarboxylate transporter substrate binding protein [Plastoroseomonas arctica]|uniref:Tripartite tricarboxylate transporter substrate binding protein n=1 Tax=Plastoroseomonas arctica TaxID=1509237 RepID=A0AAF1JX56_9PROT|nr:tripartite tricarboxylate transporter substrate-binding protein [Plastoroseomonas arctica]MBR0653694.1 tripartite tricarboxylate transporter substrate binding protein [Plastoroseomonas arctica]